MLQQSENLRQAVWPPHLRHLPPGPFAEWVRQACAFGLGLQCIWRRARLQTAVGQSLSLLSGAGPGRWQEVMTNTGSPEGVSSQLSHWLDLPQSWMLRVMERLENKNASTSNEFLCAFPTV